MVALVNVVRKNIHLFLSILPMKQSGNLFTKMLDFLVMKMEKEVEHTVILPD